jgi:hypothetical protein
MPFLGVWQDSLISATDEMIFFFFFFFLFTPWSRQNCVCGFTYNSPFITASRILLRLIRCTCLHPFVPGVPHMCSSFLISSLWILFHSSWRWRQQGPPKNWYPTTSLYDVRTQKTPNWTFTVVKISNLAIRILTLYSFSLYVESPSEHGLACWCLSRYPSFHYRIKV